ncbi:unnamed protein product [Gadus morhua 'NCC']
MSCVAPRVTMVTLGRTMPGRWRTPQPLTRAPASTAYLPSNRRPGLGLTVAKSPLKPTDKDCHQIRGAGVYRPGLMPELIRDDYSEEWGGAGRCPGFEAALVGCAAGCMDDCQLFDWFMLSAASNASLSLFVCEKDLLCSQSPEETETVAEDRADVVQCNQRVHHG